MRKADRSTPNNNRVPPLFVTAQMNRASPLVVTVRGHSWTRGVSGRQPLLFMTFVSSSPSSGYSPPLYSSGLLRLFVDVRIYKRTKGLRDFSWTVGSIDSQKACDSSWTVGYVNPKKACDSSWTFGYAGRPPLFVNRLFRPAYLPPPLLRWVHRQNARDCLSQAVGA